MATVFERFTLISFFHLEMFSEKCHLILINETRNLEMPKKSLKWTFLFL